MSTTNPNPKKKIKRKIVIESIVAFIIVISPFLFYSYEYIPPTPKGETYSLFGLDVGSLGFRDVRTFIWYILSKLIPLSLLCIWFFTCKHWWYHVIIIPLSMYAFQLILLFNTQETSELDQEEIIWILPVCMIIIPFVYLIRVKLYDKHVLGIDLEQIEADIKEMEARKEEREQNSIN